VRFGFVESLIGSSVVAERYPFVLVRIRSDSQRSFFRPSPPASQTPVYLTFTSAYVMGSRQRTEWQKACLSTWRRVKDNENQNELQGWPVHQLLGWPQIIRKPQRALVRDNGKNLKVKTEVRAGKKAN
jgi:hypothetical protein